MFDNIKEWLPGSEIYELSEFVRFLDEIGNNLDSEIERRRKVRQVMHNFCDDKNCERVVRMLGVE